MATRTVTIHDRCTTAGCGKLLHFVREAEAGQCSACWVKSMPPDKKRALQRLISVAFNGASEAEKHAVVDAAFKQFRSEEA